jgi:Co/Zn/Cd efflux system component
MHSHSIDQWTHDHVFLGSRHARHARRTWFVVALTAVMMVGEIAVGWFSGSMALLADGWHMATHAAALGIAGLAYLFARRQAGNTSFTFGTGKFGDLAAFSSAIILAMIAVQVAYESVVRLIHPVPIAAGDCGRRPRLPSISSARGCCATITTIGIATIIPPMAITTPTTIFVRPSSTSGRRRDLGSSIAALLVAMVSQQVWADPAVGIVGSLVIASWAVS